ncbi:MAG: hypothetical protein AAB447_03245 [Patescibacteria group bacterium]
MKKLFLFLIPLVAVLLVGCIAPDGSTSTPVLFKGDSWLNVGIGIPGTALVVLNDTDERILLSVDGHDKAVLEPRAKTNFRLEVVGRDYQTWTIMLQGPSGTYTKQVSASYSQTCSQSIVLNRHMLRR